MILIIRKKKKIGKKKEKKVVLSAGEAIQLVRANPLLSLANRLLIEYACRHPALLARMSILLSLEKRFTDPVSAQFK